MSDILHRKYSPSQADRFFKCPGSSGLVGDAPLRRDDEYSSEGTTAHDILAAGVQHGCYTFTAAKAHTRHKDTKFGSEFMGAVNTAFRYIAEVYAELQSKYGDAVIYVEIFVDVPVTSAPGEAGGYVDIGIHSAIGKHLYVIDYKHGVGVPVDVEGNKQVSQYGAGFLYGDNSPVKRADVELITLAIVQPRSFHKDGDIREWEVTPEYLLNYIFELDDAILATMAEDAPLVPGVSQCRFCDAKTTCPALRASSIWAMVEGASELNEVTESKLPKPEGMAPERLSYALQMAPLIKLWLKGLENYAHEQATHGHHVPGFKLVDAKPKREWYGDETENSKKLAGFCKCDPEDFFRSKFLTITDAEKKMVAAFKKNVPRNKRKEAAEDARRAFAYFTTKQSSGNLTLVSEDDARPDVSKSLKVFGNVGVLIPQQSTEE